MKLNSKNLRLILLGSLGLSAVAFIAIMILGLSALSGKSKSMVDLKVKNQTAQAQLDNLQQAKKQVDKYSYFKSVAQTVIPNDKDQAEDIAEINHMANESGIAIQSITFPASSLGGTTTVTPSSTPSATATTSAISQAKPVAGIPGLYSLELIITPQSDLTTPAAKQVTYNKMLDFFSRIENNRHTAQIAEVDITPAGAGGNTNKSLTFSLTTNIFIKP
jgi:hypothetical protein